jgi:hypothetical protein
MRIELNWPSIIQMAILCVRDVDRVLFDSRQLINLSLDFRNIGLRVVYRLHVVVSS